MGCSTLITPARLCTTGIIKTPDQGKLLHPHFGPLPTCDWASKLEVVRLECWSTATSSGWRDLAPAKCILVDTPLLHLLAYTSIHGHLLHIRPWSSHCLHLRPSPLRLSYTSATDM